MQRNQSKQLKTYEEQLALQAARWRERAEQMPPGPGREDTLQKARRADVALHPHDWLTSPGLRPPV